MNASQVVMVFVTVPSAEVGETLARALVEARLAACVNLLGPMRSVYRWQGQVEEGTEQLLLAKTRAELSAQLIEAVVARHPYECPAIEVITADSTTPACLAWIGRETGPVSS